MFLIGHLPQDIYVIDVVKKVRGSHMESMVDTLLTSLVRSLDPCVPNK